MDKLADLESFLSQVDEINEIVSGLNSTEKDVVDKYMKKSDHLIRKDVDVTDKIVTKTGFNRTFINKGGDSSQMEPAAFGMPQVPEGTSQEGFLKIMEHDAKERWARKQEARKKADELKVKGNEQFGLKNFEKALEFYTQAINTLRDNTVIYTNRAQVYIQLQKYEEAIEDCEWSMRVDEKFIKAYIHKGRALTYLKRFDEALVEFNKAKDCESASESDKRIIEGRFIGMDDRFYLFALFKELYIKLVKTYKYGLNILRFS
jgi:tetratricopeptide (TPR) repeat protein